MSNHQADPVDSGSNQTPPGRTSSIAKLMSVAIGVVAIGAGVYMLNQREGGEESAVVAVAPLPDFKETKAKAESGDIQAMNVLGEIYAEGKQVKRDYKEAVVWYRKAADQGVARAQYHLAALYEIGQGLPHDEAEAARWYRKAAEQGLADAQYNLAGMLGLGRGGTYNPKEALQWYEKAAAQGDALARYNLAERYERGRDVEQDLVEAYKWHSLAAERGLQDGKVGVEALKKRLTPDQVGEAKKRVELYNQKLGTKK